MDGLANVFAGVDIDVNNLENMAQNGGDNGQIVQAMNNLIQTLADGQQRLVEVHLEIQQERRFEERVPNCDGGDVEGLKDWIKELSLVPDANKGAVMFATARGTLLKTLQDFEAAHQHAPWAEVKAHILTSFISADHARVMLAELKRTERRATETHLTYTQRFSQLADLVYPQPDQTQTENLVKWLCRGLKDEAVVRRVVRNGRPDTLEEAINRIRQANASNEAFLDVLGRTEEQGTRQAETPMEIDAIVAAVSDRLKLSKSVKAPQPPLEKQRENTEIAKLKARIKQLEGDKKKMKEERKSASELEGGGSTRGLGRGLCFNCGQPGHLARACTASRLCYSCGQPGHLARECGASNAVPRWGGQVFALAPNYNQGNAWTGGPTGQ